VGQLTDREFEVFQLAGQGLCGKLACPPGCAEAGLDE
jgi:hypothetical protein